MFHRCVVSQSLKNIPEDTLHISMKAYCCTSWDLRASRWFLSAPQVRVSAMFLLMTEGNGQPNRRYLHGDRKNCDNYRAISLTSTFSRLFGRIVRDLIENEYSDKETEEQAGFRAGRSCNDNTFVIKQLIEKQLSVGSTYTCCLLTLRRLMTTFL